MTESTATVDPADLNGYLASRGWHQEGTSRGAFIWGLGPDCRLLVPERREYDDDAELLAEAVHLLARFEERPEPDLLLDISQPMVDTQLYRMHPDAPSGTISLPAGLIAVQAIHDLIRAAAITAEQGPQLLIEGRRSTPVDRFLRQVSLGSARPGSYVLTSRIPAGHGVPTREGQQLDLMPAESDSAPAEELKAVSSVGLAGRRVVSTLHRAIRTARAAAADALRDGGQLGSFYDGVELGLSANLCHALADLGSFGRHHSGHYRSFEVGFGWARAMPVDEPSEAVAFSENMVGILSLAGDELTDIARSGPARLTGQVEILKRGPGEQPRIKIVGELRKEDGTVLGRRSMWVTVSPAQYETAWEAQQSGQDMVVDGRLGTRRGRLQIEPSRIEVIHR